MKTNISKTLCTFVLSLIIANSTVGAEEVAATANIKFKGSSTLHDFKGSVNSKPFVASFNMNAETGGVKVSAMTELNVQDISTDNKKRDQNMFKMFDLEHFASIEGELEETTISAVGPTEATLHLKIRNVEQDVTATLSNLHRNGNQMSCLVSFPVSLKAFNLKSPSVLGMIRVDDMVYVECTVEGHVCNSTAKR